MEGIKNTSENSPTFWRRFKGSQFAQKTYKRELSIRSSANKSLESIEYLLKDSCYGRPEIGPSAEL